MVKGLTKGHVLTKVMHTVVIASSEQLATSLAFHPDLEASAKAKSRIERTVIRSLLPYGKLTDRVWHQVPGRLGGFFAILKPTCVADVDAIRDNLEQLATHLSRTFEFVSLPPVEPMVTLKACGAERTIVRLANSCSQQQFHAMVGHLKTIGTGLPGSEEIMVCHGRDAMIVRECQMAACLGTWTTMMGLEAIVSYDEPSDEDFVSLVNAVVI